MDEKKSLCTALLALALISVIAHPVSSAAETTEARVPVTLTVSQYGFPDFVHGSCLPTRITGRRLCSHSKQRGHCESAEKPEVIKVTKVDVQPGTFEIGKF